MRLAVPVVYPMPIRFPELSYMAIPLRVRYESHCGQMEAVVNPRNNLAPCFACSKNLNNIDLLMLLGYDFKEAVDILASWLARHESRRPKASATPEAG